MSRNTNTTPTINIDKTGVSHNKEDMTEFMLTGLRNRAGNGGGGLLWTKTTRKRTSATKMQET